MKAIFFCQKSRTAPVHLCPWILNYTFFFSLLLPGPGRDDSHSDIRPGGEVFNSAVSINEQLPPEAKGRPGWYELFVPAKWRVLQGLSIEVKPQSLESLGASSRSIQWTRRPGHNWHSLRYESRKIYIYAFVGALHFKHGSESKLWRMSWVAFFRC